jgi:polyketide biosynthesis enoyl-CoA hydratase PksH
MAYETIHVATLEQSLRITLNRPSQQNALTDLMLKELHAALDLAERSPACRLVVIQGSNCVFCTGMDIEEATASEQRGDSTPRSSHFFNLLRRFTVTPRVVVSLVDGRATGGGVGLAAASDFVFATERAQFGLPEALWGLLPCSVAPFFLRRVGFQLPYSMTLSTLPVNAQRAERLGLIDEICGDPNIPLQRLAARVTKLNESTIAAVKRYFSQLYPITEKVEAEALSEFDRLFSSPSVQQAFAKFTGIHRSWPWER